MTATKALGSLLLALLLLAACSHGEVEPPQGGISLGADTIWKGDTIIRF